MVCALVEVILSMTVSVISTTLEKKNHFNVS